MDSYYNNTSTEYNLKLANKYFNVIFFVEMIYKLYALSIAGYFRDSFNIFEGLLVITSLVDMVIVDIMSDIEKEGDMGVITAFRILRLLKIFKLVSKSKDLMILISAIVNTLGDVSYFSFLLFLYIFICSLLGMEFYAYNVKVDNIAHENPV
jgi:hypothetical protein